MSNSSKFGRSSIFFIEGSIGVGKSSFIEYALENATTLFPKHEVVVVSENYQDNPFLSKFYSNPRKYARHFLFLLKVGFRHSTTCIFYQLQT